jgi:hypothetical protein
MLLFKIYKYTRILSCRKYKIYRHNSVSFVYKVLLSFTVREEEKIFRVLLKVNLRQDRCVAVLRIRREELNWEIYFQYNVKAIPVTGLGHPYTYDPSRLPNCLDNDSQVAVRLSELSTGRHHLPSGSLLVLISEYTYQQKWKCDSKLFLEQFKSMLAMWCCSLITRRLLRSTDSIS